ncbi:MAG: putative bifunctional diguanylate cyclase/phosphodiesterase [Phormidium sp.]
MSDSQTLKQLTSLKRLGQRVGQRLGRYRSTQPSFWQLRHRLTTSKLRLNGSLLLLNLLVLLVMIALRAVGSFETGELAVFDAAMRRASQSQIDPRLVILEISEDDIDRYRWPLSDRELAEVLGTLQVHSPRVIGLDLYRNVAVGEGQDLLSDQLAAENLIAIENIATSLTPLANVPPERVGFNDVVIDRDQVLRRHLLFANTQSGETAYSLGLRVALKYLEPEGIGLEAAPSHPDGIRLGESLLVPLSSWAGGYHHIDDSGYQILLNYSAGPGQIQRLSISELLDGEFDPQLLRDRIVLIGSTAPTLRDLFATPFSARETDSIQVKMPGVEIHGQMVQQLLGLALGQQRPWRVFPTVIELLWGWSWIMLVMALAWRLQRLERWLGGLVLAGLGLILVERGLFAMAIWLPGVWVRWGMVLGILLTSIYRLTYDFLHDRLTGLPNQTVVYQMLRDWRFWRSQRQQSLGAIVLDLNRFKAVNACLGRATGDRILLELSKRLQALLHPSDYLARVGADEFVIFLPNQPHLDAVMEVAAQLRRRLKRPFILDTGQPVFLTASFGVAFGQQRHQGLLLDHANCAMHRAKALQLSQPIVFDADVQQQAIATFQLELDLRESMSHSQVYLPPVHDTHDEGVTDSNLPHSELGDRFRVYYQPLVDLRSGEITGFEALLRWQHPRRGMVSPAEFIPVAEETGAIMALGAWVLYEACYQMQAWQRQFPRYANSIISVNLSPYQLQSPDLKQRIGDILSETGLDPHCLKLEITESAVMEEIQTTLEILHDLKALDVKLGIDDFGTGYSSLSYLNRFPVNTLKVDRSFVWRMEDSAQDRAIIRTILDLAHTLALDAIAEGIETPAQLAQLRQLGCDIGQGYWFAKPLPAPAAAQLLARRPCW